VNTTSLLTRPYHFSRALDLNAYDNDCNELVAHGAPAGREVAPQRASALAIFRRPSSASGPASWDAGPAWVARPGICRRSDRGAGPPGDRRARGPRPGHRRRARRSLSSQSSATIRITEFSAVRASLPV